MTLSNARVASRVRPLRGPAALLLLALLLLIAFPYAGNAAPARPAPGEPVQVASIDGRRLAHLPNTVVTARDARSAVEAAAHLAGSAGAAGARAASLVRSHTVSRVGSAGVVLSDTLAAEEAPRPAVATQPVAAKVVQVAVRTPAPRVTPLPALSRQPVRTVVSARRFSGGRFFDRTAAAMSSVRLRKSISLPSAAGPGNSQIVRTALTFRGTPYRFGGRGRGGVDCSGFTGLVYARIGTPLPRTAAAQFGRGTAVDRTSLQQGDLVFFRNTYRRGISHVGIYVGNDRFIHASSSRGVRVDSLSSSYYAKKWAGARRAAAPAPKPATPVRAALPRPGSDKSAQIRVEYSGSRIAQ